MNIAKYFNKNKVGGLILIIVIIIAFGFGGFGGGFLSNNQNNIAKINKTNVTTQDFVNYINQSGVSQEAIRNNLDNDILEELLSSLISTTLLNLEVKDFDIRFSEKSLKKKIKFNENFIDENNKFERIKYEKFLLENNISAPIFERRLKDRELQKKLFDYVGAGTISPQFLVSKLYEKENRKLKINFINLENLYPKKDKINNEDLEEFIKENVNQLRVEYVDFKYSLINPQNLIGLNEFNQEFFDEIDKIENDILNGVSFEKIITKSNLNVETVNNYKYSNESNSVEKKIYELKKNKLDIFEIGENFVIYKIDNIQERKPDITDPQTKEELLELVFQKNRFDYNKKLLDQIRDKKFNENNFLVLGNDKIQSLTLNSIKDNNKFEINSIKMLYSLPVNSFTLINDEKNKIYLAKIVSFNDVLFDTTSKEYKLFITKENTRIRNSILSSYDLFLNNKYNVNINQTALNNVKNLFQ